MPYASNKELPDAVKSALPVAAQSIFRSAFNSADADGANEEKANKIAWGAVKNAGYSKPAGGEGKWVKKAETFYSADSSFQLKKVDEDERLVFGWFSVVEKDGEPLVDREGDIITPREIEKAAYNFVLKARVAGEVHMRKGVGDLVESIVFTKEKQEALGIDLGMVGWWGGFKVTDDDVWAAVKKGDYPMFSIGGRGKRVPLED